MLEGIIRKGNSALLFVGALLGFLLYLGPSLILSFLILWSIYIFVVSRPLEDRRRLTKALGIALVLRFMFFSVVMVVVYASRLPADAFICRILGHSPGLFRDFEREITNGLQIARYLKGEFPGVPLRDISHGGTGYLHQGAWIQGVLDFLFGGSFLNLLMFPLLDLWSVILVYYLGKALFGNKPAIFAATLYAVMPPTIVIACSNLRFSLTVLSFLLVALFLVKFSKDNRFKYLAGIVIGVVLFKIFREKGARPIFVILPLTVLAALNIRLRIKIFILVLAAAIFLIVFNTNPYLQTQIREEFIQNTVGSNIGFISTGLGNIYKIYDEFVYATNTKEIATPILIQQLVKAFPRGFIYFMFSPFLWEVTNTARLYAYPYLLLWYFIFSFAVLGILRSLFFRVKGAFAVILLFVFFMVLFSLVLGNEGIAARFRELLTPFFYIFAGYFICSLFKA